MNTPSLSQSPFLSFIRKIPRIPRRIVRELRTLGEFFYFRFFYKTPVITGPYEFRRLLIGGGEPLDELAKAFREIFPDKVAEKIKEADLICEHIFDLLGSGPKKLSNVGEGYQPIDWQTDFREGYQWSKDTFSKYVKYGHVIGADIIVPWELSRMQHLFILGEAYILTENEKYALEAKEQILDWIENNRLYCGVNWMTAMDAGLRALAWLICMEFFWQEEQIFDLKFQEVFFSSIAEHSSFVKGNLQVLASGLKTNHYSSGLTSLLAISLYCPFFVNSQKLYMFALDNLEKEINSQVLDDGCDFEASTSYHILVLELFLASSIFIKRSRNHAMSETAELKIRKMFEFILSYCKPNGYAPQIGDNDSGRVFKFSMRQGLDHSYLLPIATVFLKDNAFKRFLDADAEEVLWMSGRTGYEYYKSSGYIAERNLIQEFRKGGYFIVCDRRNYLMVRCGNNGQKGKGGHAHNDKLSFELVLNGEDIIVDPGTYVYTPYPEERNKFRATSYHNLVYFDGLEQSHIGDDLFSLFNEAHIDNASLRDEGGLIIFSGKIVYQGVSHERHIKLKKGTAELEIIDLLTSPFNHRTRILFHLAPGLDYQEGHNYIDKFGSPVAEIYMQDIRPLVQDYHYSPEYGVKENARCIYSEFTVGPKASTIVTHIKGL